MNLEWVAMAFLIVLFLFAYKKQTSFVRKRVEAVNSHETKDNKTKASE